MATWRRCHDQTTYRHESKNMARQPRHWKPNDVVYRNGDMHDQSQPNDTLSFENNFCWIVGGMSREWFEDAKKNIHLSDKVMQWNDSAAKEAFFDAKTRLWAEFRNCPPYISLPSPDIYIDNIDWNSDNETEDLDDQFLSISDVEADAQEVDGDNVFPASFYIPLDQIKATGWDDF
ncbi:hypothetical protein SLEP1_g7534 [Rubroshorea leprosula]|uniref:Transposase n=1 Tax=Rubroshorea leprosula TaxID=152421 RepID=A0AAV5I4H2_9ROSI|nr:hypothetical protein SLEP1_g7534 [Rubroshorea leprosula]